MSCSLGPFLEMIGHKCMNRQPLKESPAETVFLLWSRQELTVKMKQFSLGGQRPQAKGREEDGHRKVSEHSGSQAEGQCVGASGHWGMFEKNAREGLKYGWALFCFILFELHFPHIFTHILHVMILYNFEFFKFL